MHEAVEDGVGDGGVGEPLVPVFDGELTGDDGGAAAFAVFQDFEEVTALRFA